MLKKIIIIGVVLVAVGAIVLYAIPWGEYESELEKTELQNEVEYDKEVEITAPSIDEGNYSIKSTESKNAEILFSTTGLKDTKGGFGEFEISFDVKEGFITSMLDVIIQTKTINTGNVMRDEHLIEPDFFDAANYPTIEYHSTAIDFGDTSYITKGSLTLNGMTKELDIPFLHKGGGEKDLIPFEAFEGKVTFDRTQYGQVESSGAGNEVTISFYCELEKK
jgi:polyisoprenoid-binding protein YceI